MKLVIAEKPMLARDIARAICGVSVSENAKLPIKGNGYTVCACAGHLLELKEPQEVSPQWEKWNTEDLPIYCFNWQKKVSNGKSELVNNIASLLKDADIVINAGDPDDEGQLIVDEVLEYLGWQGETWRVFVNDNIEKNIRKSFKHLKKNIECASTGRAAYARQMADMCFGINETRLASCRLGTKLTVGRVQTPTLGLVVKRDRLIENHVKQKFYELYVLAAASARGIGVKQVVSQGIAHEIILKFVLTDDLLDDGKHILDKTKLERLVSAWGEINNILQVSSKEEKKYPPLPFNLTKLQSEMSKKYKFSAQKTLDVTQALRDKHKAITYNRSDCQYLKDEHFASAPPTLYVAQQNCHIKHWQLDYSIVSKCFNENNVSAHHAIIPQEVEIDIDKMTADEQKVYVAIVERYAMQFMSPAVYKVATGEIDVEGGKLKYTCKELVDKGYLAQVGEEKEEKDKQDEALRNKVCIPNGEYDVVGHDVEIVEKETTPPKRYTEGTLIADMSRISNYVKDEKIKAILKEKDDGKKGESGGIGTTATRAAIIEKLKKVGYLESKGGKLISSAKAREFYDILPAEIKGADTTAKWWLLQQAIEAGQEDVNAIQTSVIEVFNQHKDSAYIGKKIGNLDKQVVGKCPICGKDVLKKNKVCECSSNKYEKQGENWSCVDGCGFKCWSNYFDKKLSIAQLEKLITGKEVKVTGLKSKQGKKYAAMLKMKEAANRNGFFGFEVASYVNDTKKKKAQATKNGYWKK